jgi:hypothetical protein
MPVLAATVCQAAAELCAAKGVAAEGSSAQRNAEAMIGAPRDLGDDTCGANPLDREFATIGSPPPPDQDQAGRLNE